jgi:hypothetical protein
MEVVEVACLIISRDTQGFQSQFSAQEGGRRSSLVLFLVLLFTVCSSLFFAVVASSCF